MKKAQPKKRSLSPHWLLSSFAGISLCFSPLVFSGAKLIDKENTEIEIGFRVDLRYEELESKEDSITESSDDFSFYRFRPYLKAEWNDWRTKLTWELGENRDEGFRDAYVEYRGLKGISMKVGNETVAFSRERMTSSTRQNTADRNLSAENNFGSPNRQLGLHMKAELTNHLTSYVSFAKAGVYSDTYEEIRFVSLAANTDLSDDEINEGWLSALRLEAHFGKNPNFSQANFSRKLGASIGVAGYEWQADDDTPGLASHYADAKGLEVSTALRGFGFSLDLQAQEVQASINANKLSEELLDILGPEDPKVTNNLLKDNVAKLRIYTAELGYIPIDDKLELVAGYMHASSNTEGEEPSFSLGSVWNDAWTSTQAGVNLYFDKHKHRLYLGYRSDENIEGSDKSEESLIAQWQFVY